MTMDASNPIRVVVCRTTNTDTASILASPDFEVLEASVLEDCLQVFRKEHCHLMVIDYEAIKGKVEGLSGNIFEYILDTLCSAPCFILCKLPIPAPMAESMREFGFFPIADTKRSLETLPRKIRQVIDKERAVHLEIKWSGDDEKNATSSLSKKDVHWVLSHLLSPKARMLFVDESKHRSNSIVLRGRVDDLSEALLIKIGRADKVQQEIDNYSDNIHWRLVNTSYAFMERAYCWRHLNLGGIIYTFLGSRNPTETFSQFYHREGTDIITNVIAVLFDTLHKGLYGEPKLLPDNLYEAYDRYLHLTELIHNPFPDIEFGLPDASQWLLTNLEKSNLQKERLLIYQTRTHGDLWGENILVEKISSFPIDQFSDKSQSLVYDLQTWLIDFERAGWGHAFRDFVELEIDILTRLAMFSAKDSLDFYELAVSLTKSKRILENIVNPAGKSISGIRYWTENVENNFEARKAFRIIQQVRTSLTTIWGLRFSDAREYYWGLLLDSLYVALSPGLDPQQRKLAATYASILAARLENWENEKWPPDHWRKVDFKAAAEDLEKPAKNSGQKEHMV